MVELFTKQTSIRSSEDTKKKVRILYNLHRDLFDSESHVVRVAVNRLYLNLEGTKRGLQIKEEFQITGVITR